MATSLECMELCRLCLVKEHVNVPIFKDGNDVQQIFLKITACLPVKVSREDKLPKNICNDCVCKVESFYQFWNTTANAEKQLLQWLGEVGDMGDKQDFVEVLNTNVMKQEQSGDTRLEGNFIQVGGQNNIEMTMIDNMSIITMPAGSEQQFTTVPMDSNGTVQTVQVVSGPSTQAAYDQSEMVEEVEESEEDDMDDGCDNEGLPVKEETEDDNGEQQTTYISVPVTCDEAGPSGLQQQKISELTEMTLQQSVDEAGDPKSGVVIIDGKEPRVLLRRWTYMEIEMIKTQMKEFQGLVIKDYPIPLPVAPPQATACTRGFEEEKKRRKKKTKNAFFKKPYCQSCQKCFKNSWGLSVHQRSCSPLHSLAVRPHVVNPLITCKDCKSSFSSTREFFEHRQFLDCRLLSFDEESDLSENTDEEYEYDYLYTCRDCKAKFVFKELLTIHRIREKHLGQNKSIPEEDYVPLKADSAEDFSFISTKEGEYSCSACNNGFVYHDLDNLLKHHRVVHHSMSDIYCRYCCCKLNSLTDFEEHHRVYHELQRYCRVCSDDDFSNYDALPPKPVCLICCWKFGMPFDNCLALLKENLYCDDCERVLPNLASIKFHNCDKRKDPFLTVPLLVCPLCLDTFNSLRSLYRHIVKHNDKLPFECHVCDSGHETLKAVKEHIQKCHFNEELRLPKVDTLTLRKSAEEVIDKFVRHGIVLFN